MLDFEVQRSTRRCAATDRPLQPGDECVAVLEAHGSEVTRKDYFFEAWPGGADGAIGWWKWRVPEPTAKKVKLAPNDVLLELFDQLGEEASQSDLRYVLTLLLVRRRVFRLEAPAAAPNETTPRCVDSDGGETISVYCPKRDAAYEVVVMTPDDERIDEIQRHLSELLVAGAE